MLGAGSGQQVSTDSGGVSDPQTGSLVQDEESLTSELEIVSLPFIHVF